MPPAKRVRSRNPIVEESSSSVSSAQVIASNDDLLSELLLHLPIKSLLKFKSVSKHWLSIITDPHFCRCKNLKPASVSALYLVCSSPAMGHYYDFVSLHPLQTRTRFKSLNFVDHPCGINIIHSCNGLLCCSIFEQSELVYKYYIYNPTSKQFRTLPLVCGQADMQILGLNLAFDPSKSDHYKVVCVLRQKRSHDRYQILIYSSEAKCWRLSEASFTTPVYLYSLRGGAYWNGAMHWISRANILIYFDLDEELVREMSMPMPHVPTDDGFVWERIRYFGESGGHLHLVKTCEEYSAQFKVYEMESNHSGWFVKFQVDLNEVARSHPNMSREAFNNFINSFSVLCVVRGEKEEDSFLVLDMFGMTLRYNFGRPTHQAIHNCDSPRYSFRRRTHQVDCNNVSRSICGWPFVFQYIESLALV